MPEPPSNDPTAVLGRRAGAWFIDTVLCGLAAGVPALLLADAYTLNRSSDGPDVEWVEGDLALFVRDTVVVLDGTEAAITGGCLLAAVLVVFVVGPGRWGRSPGLLAADLRVVDRRGRPPGVLRALVRTLLWVLDVLPGLPLVAYLVARADRHHRRLGDLVARTYVTDQGAPTPFTAAPEEQALAAEGWEEGGPVAEPEPLPVPEPVPEPAATAPDGTPADEPIWDRRHRRYVLWHSRSGRWLEHVDGRWQPVAGGGEGHTSAPPTG